VVAIEVHGDGGDARERMDASKAGTTAACFGCRNMGRQRLVEREVDELSPPFFLLIDLLEGKGNFFLQ
jgi:hypothetical protein